MNGGWTFQIVSGGCLIGAGIFAVEQNVLMASFLIAAGVFQFLTGWGINGDSNEQ